MIYKFRAETQNEVNRFLTSNQDDIYCQDITGLPRERIERFPDRVVTIKSELKLSKIIELMKLIPDSHVMYQTIKPIDYYTGERDRDL